MAKIKNISVEIVVYRYTTKKLFDILKEEIDKISEKIEDIDIDLVIDYQKENDVWDKEKVDFNLLECIPYMIGIKEIWVPTEYRTQGVASSILSIITSIFGKNGLVFAFAGILENEYPAIKYSVEDKHDGRKIIDREKIVREELTFLAKRGFLEVSGYTNADMDRSIMLFGGPVGILAKEYMECHIVTMNRHGHNKIKRVYRELFYQTLGFANDSNAIMYPWVVEEENRICSSLSEGLDEALKDEIWYSGYQSDEPGDKEIVACAARNRDVLRLIGGAEVEITSKPEDAVWIGYNCLYFKLEEDNSNIEYWALDNSDLDEDATEEEKDNREFPSHKFQEEEDTSIVLMRGYALFNNGIWRERLWYYDTAENNIIEEVETMNNVDFPVAYVGYLCQVQSEL